MQDMSKMTPREKYQYRIKLYRDAQSWKKPDRIPFCANMFNWMYIDQGVSYMETVRDYDKNHQVIENFVQTYNVDQVNVMNCVHRNPFIVSDALGGSSGYTDNSEALNVLDRCIVNDDEFDQLNHNFPEFSWTLFFRRFPKAKDMTPQEIVHAMKLLNEFYADKAQTSMMLREKYGVVAEVDYYYFMCAFEDLFQLYRGMKNSSIDLRRHKAQVEEYVDQTTENYKAAFDAWFESTPYGPNMEENCDISTGILAHTVLNRKQFDRLYAPLMEYIFSKAAEKGKQVLVYAEGSWDRFGDFFNQFPKGTVCMMVEQDNIFELRAKYPNISLMGGIDSTLLGLGTPDQCVAQAKKVIDELGKDGGLILQPNKMLSFPNDCSRENLKAVCDFVNSYEI